MLNAVPLQLGIEAVLDASPRELQLKQRRHRIGQSGPPTVEVNLPERNAPNLQAQHGDDIMLKQTNKDARSCPGTTEIAVEYARASFVRRIANWNRKRHIYIIQSAVEAQRPHK